MCEAGGDAAMVEKIFRAIRGSMKTQNEKIEKLQGTIAGLEVELQAVSHPDSGAIRLKLGNTTSFLSMLQTENQGLKYELDSNKDGVKDIQGMINLVEAQSDKLQQVGEQIQDFETHIKGMRSRGFNTKESTIDVSNSSSSNEYPAQKTTKQVMKQRTTFDMKDVFDSMKREYNHIHDDNQHLQDECTAVSQKYRDLQSSFEELSKTRQKELADARAERKKRRLDSNRMANELYALKQQLAESQEAMTKVQRELSQANKALSAKAGELKRTERQSRVAQETHQRDAEMKLNEIGTLQTQLAKSLGAEMLCKNQLRAGRAEEEQLKSSLQVAQHKIDELMRSVSDAKKQWEAARQDSRALTETVERQKSALAQCNAEKQSAMQEMKQAIADKERELCQEQQSRIEVEQLMSQKETEAGHMSQTLSELQTSFASQDEKFNKMRSEKVALLAEAQSGARMQNMLKQQLEAFRKEMESQQHEIASLQDQTGGVAQNSIQEKHSFAFAFK